MKNILNAIYILLTLKIQKKKNERLKKKIKQK